MPSLQHDFSLRSFNTFGIDANASSYLEITSSDDLFQVFNNPEPVEIDASRRATVWLQRAGITSAYDHPMAVSALRSAAYTYVVAALSSLATLIYYALMLVGASNDD